METVLYHVSQLHIGNGKLLGRTKFITIIHTFARGNRNLKTGVDYTLYGLVPHNNRTLQRFVDAEEPLPQRRKVFLSHFSALKDIFKYYCSIHVRTYG